MLDESSCSTPYGVERNQVMAQQVNLTEAEVRAFASLLVRVSDRLSTYEEQTHQDQRYAEELKEAANDLLSRLDA
jgi:cell shape-determining protein MreC